MITAEQFWRILFTEEAYPLSDWLTVHHGEDCIITPRRFDEALRALNAAIARPE